MMEIQTYFWIDLNNILFALPPADEQQKILKRVETLFSTADQMEVKLKRAQSGVDKLTTSILAKAFRG
jgi:type I restriction enzyme, S subunit